MRLTFNKLFFLVILFLATVSSVSACHPVTPAICQAYSRAEAVFVGKLLSVEEKSEMNFAVVYATFSVKKIYKGEVMPTETVKFGGGDCDPKVSEIGQDYFVFKENYRHVSMIANLTAKVSDSAAAVKYAKHLSASKPVFRIGGFIFGLEPGELRRVKVIIKHGSSRRQLSIGNDRVFNFVTRNNAEYEVKILLPFKAPIFVKLLNEYRPLVDGDSVTYQTRFRPNECDFREIEVGQRN